MAGEEERELETAVVSLSLRARQETEVTRKQDYSRALHTRPRRARVHREQFTFLWAWLISYSQDLFTYKCVQVADMSSSDL